MSEQRDENEPEGAPTGQIKESLSTKVIKTVISYKTLKKSWNP